MPQVKGMGLRYWDGGREVGKMWQYFFLGAERGGVIPFGIY
jgi:hypothetical protein